MNKRTYTLLLTTLFLAACGNGEHEFDASGSFETDDVVVSAEQAGRIILFSVEEGDSIPKGKAVGEVDAENTRLQKEQVEESIRSLQDKTADVSPQVKLLQDQLAVQETRVANLEHEKKRIGNLVRQDAATGKQLDDISFQLESARKEMVVTQQQIKVQQNNVSTQNRSVLSESKPLSKRVAQLEDQLKRAMIVNPIDGTVTAKYAEEGEYTNPGKALYKIADLSVLTLRAYVTGAQLSELKLGQPVKVWVDKGADEYREYPGNITWISGQAEFTPKTIQTKDERANLVYALKIKVRNDGYLKIGMYGEVEF